MYRLLKKDRRGQTNTWMIVAITLLVVVIGFTAFYMMPKMPEENGESPQESSIPEFDIQIVGKEGDNITLTEDDFEEVEETRMVGGLMTSAGSIRGPYNYTGVKLDNILSQVGGMNEENSLRVTASDGYSMVFTWEELNGNFTTFNPATGDEVSHEAELIPVLAYEEDGELLEEGDGPIRLVILGEEGLITEGHFWIKRVTEIEVISAVKEYTLSLEGKLSEEIDRGTFESGANCPATTPDHKGVYQDEDGKIWTGIPLWLLVGRIDDQVHHEAGAYNRELADVNAYTVNVIAGDGYTVSLNSSFVKLNENILIANELDGAPLPEPYWPLRLVGSDLSKGQMVRNVVKIQLEFNESVPEPEPVVGEWNLTLDGAIKEVIDSHSFVQGTTCEEAEHESVWIDPDGQEWTGIPAWLLVGRVDDENNHGPEAFNRNLAEEGYQVEFIASDGYSVKLNSTTIALNDNIIVAYLKEGEPLPEEKAPLRLVGEGLRTGQMVYNLVEIKLELE